MGELEGNVVCKQFKRSDEWNVTVHNSLKYLEYKIESDCNFCVPSA